MSEVIRKRGRPRKNPLPEAVEPAVAPAPRRRKNIIGTGMPYVAPEAEVWTGSAVGYRPKAKKSRPILQPNRV